MSCKYSLYDFDARGLAEPLRLILAYGGVPFEDVRSPCDSIYSALTPEIKQKCPWGDVPFLEVEGGRKLAQSLAIGRYLAKEFGLTGSNEIEAALCDEYVDTCQELFFAWFPLYKEKDPEKLKTVREEVKTTLRSKYLTVFNKIVEDNGGNWLVGGRMTWADIYLAHNLNDGELSHGISFLEEYPDLKTLYENVFTNPKIKAWVSKRPMTLF